MLKIEHQLPMHQGQLQIGKADMPKLNWRHWERHTHE